MKKIILYALLAILNFSSVWASHVSGGDITYKYLSPNKYEITVKLFRDCEGISMTNTISVYFSNTCGLTSPASISCSLVPNPITGQDHTDISQLCDKDVPNSTCNNGNLPGMELYEYRGIVTFPAACNAWTIYYTTCCRNDAIINIDDAFNQGIYFGATINSQTAPTNSSPVFTSHPIPYVCINTPVNYNFGVVEPDGDSLVYRFVTAKEDYPATNLPYVSPYTSNLPIQGIVLDQATGQITFTPNTLGNFVVVVEVTEYDANGNIIGKNFRDIQFVVQNCNNQVVNASTISISNSTGDGTVISPKVFQACEGDNFCFDIVIQDPDAGDSLEVTSNIQSIFPGATLTYTGINPITAKICGNVTSGSNSFNVINFETRDNACPVVGLAAFSITIKVISSTTTSKDSTICLGDSYTLEASGGSTFTWSTLSGPPIAVGTNFSCNPCKNPVATPTATTTYLVTSDLTGGCKNTDTVTITVAPNFTYTLTQSSNASCKFEPVNFNLTTNPAGNYTYAWNKGNLLNDSTIANPIMTPIGSGLFVFNIAVTSDLGCVKRDSLQVNVSQGVKPDVTAFADVDTVSCNGIVNLEAQIDPTTAIQDVTDNFDNGSASSMWASITGATVTNTCDSKNNSPGALVFDGTTGNRTATTVPLQGNTCTTIDFWLKPASGGSGACNSPESGDNLLLQYSINGGTSWVTMQTFTESMWGTVTSATFKFYSVPVPSSTSNIIIRFNQPSANYTSGAYDYWILDDVSISCSSIGNFVYAWSPSTSVSSPNQANTSATPTTNTTYNVIVSDPVSGCADTSDITIYVNNVFPTISITADDTAGCYPVAVNFTNTTDPTTVGTVEWNFGNGTTSNQLIQPNTVIYNTPGIYDVYVKVTSSSGCVSDTTYSQLIEVFDYPTANFNAGPQPTNVSNPTINFTDLSSNDVVNWNWSFGISPNATTPGGGTYVNTSTNQNPIISYPEDKGGEYMVQLIVENIHECSDTTEKVVIIDDLYAMYVPNSFTPDGDGVNDEFLPYSEQITEKGYEFIMFDRWGNKIFVSTTPGEAWDGKVNGVLLPSAVYVWTLSSIDENTGDKYRYRGHVMMLH